MPSATICSNNTSRTQVVPVKAMHMWSKPELARYACAEQHDRSEGCPALLHVFVAALQC